MEAAQIAAGRAARVTAAHKFTFFVHQIAFIGVMASPMTSPRFLLLGAFLLSCAQPVPPAPPEIVPDEAEPSEPAEPSDLGQSCFASCNLATCSMEVDNCESGICVWDSAVGGGYCSRTCDSSCAPGFRCDVVADDVLEEIEPLLPVCIPNVAVCGNGIREVTEACDDGNTAAQDTCATHCGEITVPPSGGTVVSTFHGTNVQTASGLEPVVKAIRQFDRLFIAANQVNHAFDVPADAGPAPYNIYFEAGIEMHLHSCWYAGATNATILELDHDQHVAKGSATMTLYCNGFDCGSLCSTTIPYHVEFDVHWVDRP